MKTGMKVFGAFLAGLLTAMLAVAGVEGISSLVHPPPAGLDFNDRAALAAWIETLPTSAFLVVCLAWFLGAGFGAWTAARLAPAGAFWVGLAVGGAVLAGAFANLLAIPHPRWMWKVGLNGIGVAAIVGALFGARRAEPDSD